MSGITDRITEVLGTHRFERWSVSEAGYFTWWGHCTGCDFESHRRNRNYVGWELDMRDDESAHVAEVLVAELASLEHRPGLLAAADVLDGYLTAHPDTRDGRDIYHLLQELRYMADNPVDESE